MKGMLNKMMSAFKGRESKKEEMREMKMAGSKAAYERAEKSMEGSKSTSKRPAAKKAVKKGKR